MNDTTPDMTCSALRALASAFVTHPEDIVAWTDSGELRNVLLRGNPADDPLLIGKNGAHVQALQHIAEELAGGASWFAGFKCVTKRQPKPAPRLPPKSGEAYDPKPTVGLLELLLGELLSGSFAITVRQDRTKPGRAFVLDVFVREPADYTALTAVDLLDRTIVGSLGTLFRAIGRANGVEIALAIRVAEPVPTP